MGPLNVSSISRGDAEARTPRTSETTVSPFPPSDPEVPLRRSPEHPRRSAWRVNNRQYLFRIGHGSVWRLMRSPGLKNDVTGGNGTTRAHCNA